MNAVENNVRMQFTGNTENSKIQEVQQTKLFHWYLVTCWILAAITKMCESFETNGIICEDKFYES